MALTHSSPPQLVAQGHTQCPWAATAQCRNSEGDVKRQKARRLGAAGVSGFVSMYTVHLLTEQC